ncbi:MAG TPA: cytochrome C [Muricauda sp.]|uniref:Heme-binding domain-containing protein n=1 Tax=Flagellimonas aurea TaxID=2915619 RepID=A0ABS3G6J5_9FLAO|nr:heme-binding domain-containing protein [Allomuricauda aurea]MAO15677.1 cytochrome C [Allomuricauda sp.]MBC70945.1 cytochrome C [Allomuricauda sp.]MBO0354192.1 heme-binding domain-containing protein [Allomuricauda aurea]HBU76788.1 cytochrome C [Allomuricauda sp.]|tara:strand:- start:126 stop:578 length:453 start_codon:yes stop_codon:yes gene_type:complete
MKIVKKIAIVLLIVLIGMQFYRPEKNKAEGDYVAAFEAETQPSVEVKQILKTACYDCHSANTEYPWYNNIAPVSYWLADHIEDGKRHLNFSDWENYDSKKKDHKLEEVIEEVKEGKMPLNEYTWTHADANLSEDQISALLAWANNARANY